MEVADKGIDRLPEPGLVDDDGRSEDGKRLPPGKRPLQVGNLDNRGHLVKTVVLGLPGGSDGASVGSILFDNYTSTP